MYTVKEIYTGTKSSMHVDLLTPLLSTLSTLSTSLQEKDYGPGSPCKVW